MARFRRWLVPGGTYFFTLVAQDRQQIFDSPLARRCLRTAMREVRKRRPFNVVAIVVLPDHLHTVWELPRGDVDYSLRWRQIKTRFTQLFFGWRRSSSSGRRQ